MEPCGTGSVKSGEPFMSTSERVGDEVVTAKHPAPFTDVIIERFAHIVGEYVAERETKSVQILDPFAGIGGIHKIPGLLGPVSVAVETVGVEIEENWANAHPLTLVGDATALPFVDDSFDFVMTSCCYGNRMADHHDAKDDSKRITYRHCYGEELQENNAGMMQWTDAKYKTLHRKAWMEARRVLKPDGIFVLNISNHIRKGKIMRVVEWHLATLLDMGLSVEYVERIHTPRMGFGQNGQLRVNHEHIIVMHNSDEVLLKSGPTALQWEEWVLTATPEALFCTQDKLKERG